MGELFGNPNIRFLLPLSSSPALSLLQLISLSSGHQIGRRQFRWVGTSLLSTAGAALLAVAPPGSRHGAAELLLCRWKTDDFGGVSGESLVSLAPLLPLVLFICLW